MDIFAEPNIKEEFACSPIITSIGFTKLMKWVLLTRSNPDLLTNIKHLVETDFSILEKQNYRGWTALMLSCRNVSTFSTLDTVKLLLDLGANPNAQRKNGVTALMILSAYFSETPDADKAIELLFAAGADVNIRDHDGYQALHHACYQNENNLPVMKILIDHKADINSQENNKNTPLMACCTIKSEKNIEFLVNCGADVDLKKWNDITVIDMAYENKLTCLPLLESKSAVYSEPDPAKIYSCSPQCSSIGWTKLMKWVLLTRSYPKLLIRIEELVKGDPSILNKQNTHGWTALYLAVRNVSTLSTIETVKLLIQLGADPNIKRDYGYTPLMSLVYYAKTPEDFSTIEFLLDNNADVNAKDDGDRTVLMWCMENKKMCHPIAKLLITKGADINAQTKSITTVLHYACIHQQSYDLIQFLIDNGANTKIHDLSGNLALAYIKPASTIPENIKALFDDLSIVKTDTHIILTVAGIRIKVDKATGLVKSKKIYI